jgi:ABC-type transport system involved in cytochrome c biogenesis permease subunit
MTENVHRKKGLAAAGGWTFGWALAGAAVLVVAIHFFTRTKSDGLFVWDDWRRLAVLDGGRVKPLDSLARETMEAISGAGLPDCLEGQPPDALGLYTAMFLEWDGHADPPTGPQQRSVPTASEYFHSHRPDSWDDAPLLRVDNRELKAVLGLNDAQRFASPVQVYRARVDAPGHETAISLLRFAEELSGNGEPLTPLEQSAVELAGRFMTYAEHRMGKELCAFPVPGMQQETWLSAAALEGASLDEASDPTGGLRRARNELRSALVAYREGQPDLFRAASARLREAVEALAIRAPSHPGEPTIELEVRLHEIAPFRAAWIATASAFGVLLLELVVRRRGLYRAGWCLLGLGTFIMIGGIAARIVLAGHLVVTNMHESIAFAALGSAVVGMVLEWINPKQVVLVSAAAIATVALLLIEPGGMLYDQSISPPEPVLNSNFWLVAHVATAILGFAALALALGVANVTLAYYLAGSTDHATIACLTTTTHRALLVGVCLLALGTLAGALWADLAWGRLWGWDPKEVWALATLLGYLSVLIAWKEGWVRPFGFAVLSVVCFTLVVMAWFGVNLGLKAGLHKYGFRDASVSGLVIGLVAVQGAYVLAAAACHTAHRREEGGLAGENARTDAARELNVGRPAWISGQGDPILP